jgi:hypothetical protein
LITFDDDDKDAKADESFEAYIGAELYNRRMWPQGCPSYQKAFIKIFKVLKNPQGSQRLQLLETRFFDNREGFGHINRNLTKGDYEIHFKKYSGAFDVFDFTVKIYSKNHIKMIDEDEHEIQKVKLTPEQLQNIPELGTDINKNKKKKQNKKQEKPEKPEGTANPAPATAETAPTQATPDAAPKPD